jgi:phosphate transport system permease protein
LGTIILVFFSAVIVTPFAVSFSLYKNFYCRNNTIKSGLDTLLHALNTVPSIIFGIVGFIVFVKGLAWEKSWLAGSIILALMIFPTVTAALSERIQTLPQHYSLSAHAMGFNPSLIVRKIIMPYSLPGLLTGLILGVARAAGETAPIMFCAAVFSGVTVPDGIKDNPLLALPYHIFSLSQDVYSKSAMPNAWASAFTLVCIVGVIMLFAIPFRARLHEEAQQS